MNLLIVGFIAYYVGRLHGKNAYISKLEKREKELELSEVRRKAKMYDKLKKSEEKE